MMNYSSRVMPNIQPYPHDNTMSDTFRAPFSPSTPTVGSMIHHVKPTRPDAKPVIVPSMVMTYPDSFPTPFYQRHPINLMENQNSPCDIEPQTHKKDLVNDVFFSPAMPTFEREASPISTSSQSDCESDITASISPPDGTPSALLLDDQHYGVDVFGLGLGDIYEYKKALSPTASTFDQAYPSTISTYTAKSQVITSYGVDEGLANKRRRNSTTSLDSDDVDVLAHIAKKTREASEGVSNNYSTFTFNPSVYDELFDASGEESSDDEDSSVSSSNARLSLNGHQDGDSFSKTSWEDPQREVDENDSDAEENCKESSMATMKKTSLFAASKDQPTELEEEDAKHSGTESFGASVEPRPTARSQTIYQKLTEKNVDWCRYCGTTEGVNWRPGPWGKRTLCNKHGCDYKGYGFACKEPRLNLTEFKHEKIEDRDRPVLQLFCSECQCRDSWEHNVLVRCEGCPKAFHQKCLPNRLSDEVVNSNEPWYCDEVTCRGNYERKRIVVELPRKRLPLMSSPKSNSSVQDSPRSQRFPRN